MSFLPPTVNIHIVKQCNYRCSFCFAHFRETASSTRVETWSIIIRELLANGAKKINFAGGEPTLYRDLARLIQLVQAEGGVASVVTNGTGVPRLLRECRPAIIGLSVDSSSDSVNAALGRGNGKHASRTRELAALVREVGARLKINTVVTRLAVGEDMAEFIASLAPERWKLFQVLPIRGENDGKVEDLLITAEEFQAFVERHRRLEALGIRVVPETNEAMTGSYAMIDPDGRFFDNSNGELRFSEPILEAGLSKAWTQVTFSSERFLGRGGDYR
jgi:radical S-adenosyl methionine domain-containing protein 2